MPNEVFHINWPDGCADINVGTFFSASPAPQVNRLLRLCHRYSAEGERLRLLSLLHDEDEARRKLLEDKAPGAKRRQQEFLRSQNFHSYEHFLVKPDKTLTRQRKTLAVNIKKVSAEVWPNAPYFD